MHRFYQPFVPAGGVCFDLGSHLGNRIPVFFDLGATIVGIEPHPECLKYLWKHYGDETHVIIEPFGVAETSGERDFYLSDATPTVSTMADDQWKKELNAAATFKSRWDRKIVITVTTLDRLIQRHGVPDFTKIDVEGMEEAVLQGLSQPLPALSFVFFALTPNRSLRVLEHLEDLGTYTYNWSIREQHQLQEPEWLSAKDLKLRLMELQDASYSGDIYARLQTLTPGN